MDGRTGRVAYGGGNPHAGGLTLLRHGEAVLRRLGNRAGHSGRRLRGRLSGQLIQHLRDRAAGLPGGTDRTAGIGKAAAQRRDSCGRRGRGDRCNRNRWSRRTAQRGGSLGELFAIPVREKIGRAKSVPADQYKSVYSDFLTEMEEEITAIAEKGEDEL